MALFTRFGINGTLARDEAIYAYAGQRLAHGVPPYVSIFDAKGPLAGMIAGLAAAVARVVGRNDIYVIRAAFFACAVLAVLAVYLLAARLWSSVAAGLTAAVVFASFRGFATDALSGPDAKTPGILLTVLVMWLLVRRQWFWAAFAGSLAFLVWQPFLFYPLVAVLVAVVSSEPRRRLRSLGIAVAGAAVPLVLTAAYLSLAGAMGKFVQSALVFPLTGVKRGTETVGQRITHIISVVHDGYGFSGVLLWVGLAALVLLAVVHVLRNRGDLRQALVSPLISVVMLTFLAEAAYALSDFQGYQDVYPLLPYAALGLGGAAAYVVNLWKAPAVRPVAAGSVLVALAVLAGFSLWSFTGDPANDNGLRGQRSDACALDRMLPPHGTLYALGDATPLVLLHRRNPGRFIYLQSGVGPWKVEHTPGGFLGWTSQIQAAHPSVVVVHGWHGDLRLQMGEWLRKSAGLHAAHLGPWRVYLTPAARALARRHGIRLTHTATDVAIGPGGRPLPAFTCG